MTAFYSNDIPESKAMFEALHHYLEEVELTDQERVAGKLLLQSFGSRSNYSAISGNLKGMVVEDDRADRGEHPAEMVFLGYSQHLGWLEDRIIALTFRYEGIRNLFSKYPTEGFLQHYFALHAFYLTGMMGLQIRLCQFLLQVEDHMKESDAVYTLKSMDDLLGNQISCATSKEGVSNLLRIFYGNALIMGLRFMPYFEKNRVEESFQFFLDNLPEIEESEPKLAMAHLDTLPIFRKWYRECGENPFSQGILNLVVKADPTPILPRVLDLSVTAIERVPEPEKPEKKVEKKPEKKTEKPAAKKPGPKPKPKEEKLHGHDAAQAESGSNPPPTPPVPEPIEEPPAENFLAWMAQK